MASSSRGFVKTLLVLLVLIAAIAGGAYFYFQQKVEDSFEVLNSTIQAHFPGCEMSYESVSTDVVSNALTFDNLRFLCEGEVFAAAETMAFSNVEEEGAHGISLDMAADNLAVYMTKYTSRLKAQKMTEQGSVAAFYGKELANLIDSDLVLKRFEMSFEMEGDEAYEVSDLKMVSPTEDTLLLGEMVHRFDDSEEGSIKGVLVFDNIAQFSPTEPLEEYMDLELAYDVKDEGRVIRFTDVAVFTEPEDFTTRTKLLAFAELLMESDVGMMDFKVDEETGKFTPPQPMFSRTKISGYEMYGVTPQMQAVMARAGYQPLMMNILIEMERSPVDMDQGSFEVDIAGDGFGEIYLKADLTGLSSTKEAEDLPSIDPAELLADMPKIKSASLKVKDQPGRDRILNALSEQERQSAQTTLPVAAMVVKSVAAREESKAIQNIANSLSGFIMAGGELTIDLKPAEAVSPAEVFFEMPASLQEWYTLLNPDVTYMPVQ